MGPYPSSYLYPIFTVQSLDGCVKDNIHVELEAHADNSVVDSNVLGEYDQKHYLDIYCYSSKYRLRILLVLMLL